MKDKFHTKSVKWEEHWTTRIVKNGNALAINIPAHIRKKYDILVGDTLNVTIAFYGFQFNKQMQKVVESHVKQYRKKGLEIEPNLLATLYVLKGLAKIEGKELDYFIEGYDKEEQEEILKINKQLDRIISAKEISPE